MCRGLAARIVTASDVAAERRRLAQLLVDQLSDEAGLTECRVTIADRPQAHQHDGQRLQSKTYGYYSCAVDGADTRNARIRIYHRTAVRQQVIAPKVFLNTVVHEWVHHYDFAGLRLGQSPHTSGFYARLRDLAERLEIGFVLPPEPEPSVAGAVP